MADIDDYVISGLVRAEIDNFADRHIMPGDFVRAVLENDLRQTIQRATDHSHECLRDILRYLVWEIPAQCWGSREKVATWVKAR